MQQEQRGPNREPGGTFEEPGDHASGCRIVDLRHHRNLGRRSQLGMARARRCGGRITGECLLASVVAITPVVRLPGRMGRTDNLGVRRQLAGVTQNEKQDYHGEHPTARGRTLDEVNHRKRAYRRLNPVSRKAAHALLPRCPAAIREDFTTVL